MNPDRVADAIVFVGWDPLDAQAFRVALQSMWETSPEVREGSIIVEPLVQADLRRRGLYSRCFQTLANGQKMDLGDNCPHSTEFSYTRFLTPHLAMARGITKALFVDADVMFLGNVADLFALADAKKMVQVVKHDMVLDPDRGPKMGVFFQSEYEKKNWSSVMLFPDARKLSDCLNPLTVSSTHRNYLHQFGWVEDKAIGALPEHWNWLEGYSKSAAAPCHSLVHFTRGTPDMIKDVDPVLGSRWDEFSDRAGSAMYPFGWGALMA